MRAVILVYLGILTVWDVRDRRVPAWSLLLGGLLLAGRAVGQCAYHGVAWRVLLVGVIPGLILLIAAKCTHMVGYADGIVLAELGMYLGCRGSVLILCISLVLAAVYSILLLVRHRVPGCTEIPFLPFLLAGFVIQNFGMRG